MTTTPEPGALTPVITEHWDDPQLHTLDGYRAHGGYRSLSAAFGMAPDDVALDEQTLVGLRRARELGQAAPAPVKEA